MTTSKLKTEIYTYLNDNGFKDYERGIDKLARKSKGFTNKFKDMFNFKKPFGAIFGNSLVQMATGAGLVIGTISKYKKAVEASNYQIEQETKLYATMRGQGFRDEQIASIKSYASELQNLGVVGDEVTLAGAQQLAGYHLTEKNLKRILPAMQELILKQKGLKGTGQDAVSVADMFGKGILGKVTRIEQAGIALTDYEKQLIKTGTQEQKVSTLIEAVTKSVGKQNAEFYKTPEGKIAHANNAIGDMYEDMGKLFRDVRGRYWSFMADNLDSIAPFFEGTINVLANGFDTLIGSIDFLFKTLANTPSGVKTTIGLITGLFMLNKFPIVAGVMILEDLFGAFQGKDSVIEDCFNALTEFANSDYKFADLRKGVLDFWTLFNAQADTGIDKINLTTTMLLDLLDVLKGGWGLFKLVLGGAGTLLTFGLADTPKDIFKSGWGTLSGAGHHMNYTNDLYENYLNDKANKDLRNQIEEMTRKNKLINSNDGALPLTNNFKDGINIVGIPITENTGYKKQEILKEVSIKEIFEKPVKKDFKISDKEKARISNNKVEIKSNPTFSVTIHANDSKDVVEKFKKVANEVLDEHTRSLKVQYGGNFGFGALD